MGTSSGPRGGYLEALLTSCPVAILATDAEGVIKFANKAACELLEREIHDVIGESIIIAYESLEAARKTNRELYMKGGTIHDHESTAKTKTGELIPVRISASHMKDSMGNYIGAVGYFEKYRPWSKEERRVKERVEKLAAELKECESISAPIFELYAGLTVVIISGPVDGKRIEHISADLLNHMETVKTRVVLIDLTVALVGEDSVVSQLIKTMRTFHLLGIQCVLAGMKASIARVMEPLLTDLGVVKSFHDREAAIEAALASLGLEVRKKS